MTAITTPKGILSYPHFDKPHAPPNTNSEPKYGCTLIFPEGTNVKAMQEAYLAAGTAQWGADRSKWPEFEKKNMCLRKGKDVTGTPDKYKDCFVLVAKSNDKPICVYARKDSMGQWQRIEDADLKTELYGGAIVQLRVNFYAYPSPSQGIGAGLNGVFKVANCAAEDRLDGRESVDEMFAGLEESEEAVETVATPGNGADPSSSAPAAADPWD